ncbi:MAG: hypothetical protein JW729_10535, partial [Bacteroidales bacterium]|nr:hypothetical protein [Bacteroidales bacterium]
MLSHRFYSVFGELLYAIAISDSKVQEEEIEEITRITRELMQEYFPKSNPELNSFNALLTETGFFADIDAGKSKQEALNNFLEFYSQNKQLFTKEIKEFCLLSITRIAQAYAGIVTEE